jgi:hypothetical protein
VVGRAPPHCTQTYSHYRNLTPAMTSCGMA